MPTRADSSLSTARELREVLGRLIRRLRATQRVPLSHGAVLGRLDRTGNSSVSELAAAEGVRPQSMAQTVADLEAAGLVARAPDPADGRRMIVSLTPVGRSELTEDRRRRADWLAEAIDERLTAEERDVLARAVSLLDRLADG